MTKYAFPAYAFYKQKRYLRRHLSELTCIKLHIFISRFQEINTYLEEFSSDTEYKETEPFPTDKIMYIIYQFMPTMWKKKMIEQSFNYTDSTIKEMTKFPPRTRRKRHNKKRKGRDSDSSVIESNEEF